MNIHGYKQKLARAREMIKQEEAKGKGSNSYRIRSIKEGMRNTKDKIDALRKNKKEVKRNGKNRKRRK